MTPAEFTRFERQIFHEPNSGCWLWGGALMNGYGAMRAGDPRLRRTYRTHVLSYEHFHGPVPPEMQVCHRCDVRACVNPDHLFTGTAWDNVHDMIRKGRARYAHGAAHYQTGLCADDIREIRRLFAVGLSTQEVGVRFGISRQAAADIKFGRTWKHVDGKPPDIGGIFKRLYGSAP